MRPVNGRQREGSILLGVVEIQVGSVASTVLEFVARNWALMSIATTLVLLVVVPAVFIRKYVRIALNLMDDFAPPVRPETPATTAERNDGTSVDFSAFDGHLLRGTLLPGNPQMPQKGVVIFAHEFGTDRFSHTRYSQPLRAAGYDVFAFDFRGHGESPPEKNYKPRQFPSDREQSDMLGAIAFIEDHLEDQGRPQEVGLFGVSRGGGAAILASVGIDSVKAVAVDGAFSGDTVLEHLLKHWASVFAKLRVVYENHPPWFWRFLSWLILVNAKGRFGAPFPSVRKALTRIRSKPLLFIHGERDTFIPLEQTQMLYGLASDPKYFWPVPGARHNQSVVKQPQEYARHIVAFYDRYLACGASQQPESQRQHGCSTLIEGGGPTAKEAPDSVIPSPATERGGAPALSDLAQPIAGEIKPPAPKAVTERMRRAD